MTSSEVPRSLHQNRARASSFGDNAELYDRTRPRYPTALLDELLAPSPTRVLDVGCGTGILGCALASRGADVLGVEPDDKMAALATRHGLDVEVAAFETWDARGRTFDLLVAGQAWHWVEPDLGARKAASVVNPRGTVALAWNVGSLGDPLREQLDAVYATHAPGKAQPLVPHRRDDGYQSRSELAFLETGDFDGPFLHVFPWAQPYTTAEWLDQLETHSDHHLLEPAQRAELLAAVGHAIDAAGGILDVQYDCEVTRYTRR
jgi:SAM-dependent methyltransferase